MADMTSNNPNYSDLLSVINGDVRKEDEKNG